MRCYGAGIMAVFLFFLCLSGISAESPESSSAVQLTKKELGFAVRGEYNRTFASGGDFALFGALELNERYTFKAGFALGNIDNDAEIKAFSSGHISPFSKVPLCFNFSYMYYSLPEPIYDYHAHSLLPYLSLDGHWAGLAVGYNFRFITFFDEPPMYEPALAFLGYVNFLHNEKLRVGLSCANFSEFYMGNMGAYSFKLSSDIHVTGRWTILFELELLQSGGDGLTSTFYGIAYRGGVRFAW
ncbi:MAG: hypothetical protein FWD36_04725 [Treponema sp.]|nr:hypothetical protein [Treponema sp.]